MLIALCSFTLFSMLFVYVIDLPHPKNISLSKGHEPLNQFYDSVLSALWLWAIKWNIFLCQFPEWARCSRFALWHNDLLCTVSLRNTDCLFTTRRILHASFAVPHGWGRDDGNGVWIVKHKTKYERNVSCGTFNISNNYKQALIYKCDLSLIPTSKNLYQKWFGLEHRSYKLTWLEFCFVALR